MAPVINPIYAGFERSCPRDSKNVSYVDVGLAKWWWGGAGGGLSKNLVKPWA